MKGKRERVNNSSEGMTTKSLTLFIDKRAVVERQGKKKKKLKSLLKIERNEISMY